MKLVPKVTLKEMITNSSLRQPLIIAMMMMLAQQLSGINCAIFYSTDIFEKAGLNDEASQGATLGMGSMNVLMTVVSLILIEKAGRKTLMIVGLSSMLVMTTLLLVSLLTYVSLRPLRKLRVKNNCCDPRHQSLPCPTWPSLLSSSSWSVSPRVPARSPGSS